jgi:hypothetical protein
VIAVGTSIATGSGVDPNKLWSELANGHLWLVLGSAAISGVIGSVLHPPISDPPGAATPPPPKPPSRGWAALSGAVAAVALLYVTQPDSGTALIGGSLVAGFAANAVLAGLQARVLAATSAGAAAANLRMAAAFKHDADANARLAEERGRETLRVSRDLDQLASAAETGSDLRPLVRDLRARRDGQAQAPA